MERYIEWEFTGRVSKNNFLAAEAVAIVMDEGDCDPAAVTADIARRAAERLGDGFDGQSVQVLVGNCRFWRVKKKRVSIIRCNELIDTFIQDAPPEKPFIERLLYAHAYALGVVWANLSDEVRIDLLKRYKKEVQK